MNQLTKHEPLPLERPQTFDVEGIFRLAIEKGGGVETIERLMAVRRELNSEQAKGSFDSAMAAFQAECPVVHKPKGVKDNSGTHAYSYAPFEHVISTVRPTLEKHGFSFTLDTDTESKDGWVIAKCKVTHSAGHSETSTAKFPLGGGTRIMSTTQIYAAALTFASRRVFQNAFGIVCAGEDFIEEGTRPKPPGPSTLAGEKPLNGADTANKKKLVDLTRNVHGCKGYALTDEGKAKLQSWLIDECMIDPAETLEGLTGANLAGAVAKVERKLR